MTSRCQSGWKRSAPSWESNEQHTRKEPTGFKNEVDEKIKGPIRSQAVPVPAQTAEEAKVPVSKRSKASKPRGSSNTPVKAYGTSRKSSMEKKAA